MQSFIHFSDIYPAPIKEYMLGDIGTKKDFVLYNYLEKMNILYPNFNDWYFKKVAKEVMSDKLSREIILSVETEKRELFLTGLVILKKTPVEKKICTVLVDESFRNNGIGESLFKEAFCFLETDKPLITVSEEKYLEFASLFDKFNFKRTQVLDSYYLKDKKEFVYNGFM